MNYVGTVWSQISKAADGFCSFSVVLILILSSIYASFSQHHLSFTSIQSQLETCSAHTQVSAEDPAGAAGGLVPCSSVSRLTAGENSLVQILLLCPHSFRALLKGSSGFLKGIKIVIKHLMVLNFFSCFCVCWTVRR